MSKKGDKHYTKNEVDFIIENFPRLSYKEIGLALKRPYGTIYSKCRRMGLITVDPEHPRLRVGPLSGNWRGGISKHADGYLRDNVAGKLVHTLVMEKEIGRELVMLEMIHHIDGDKVNNEVLNLFLCKNASEHRLIHASLERAAFELVRKGVLRFDRETKEYR